MTIKKILFICMFFIWLIPSAEAADDINIVPSNLCGDRLKKIGVRSINPLFLVYEDDLRESYEQRFNNIETVEPFCREIKEVLLETKSSILLQAGFKQQAKKIIDYLVSNNSESWTVLQSAGLFYDAIENYGQAIVFFEKAKLKDSDWSINMNLVRPYYMMGRDKDAVKAYLTALTLNSGVKNIKEVRSSYFAACKRLEKLGDGCP